MRILLTGATGFIGQNLAKFLITQGNKVYSLGRRKCSVHGVRHIQLSSLAIESLEDALKDYCFDAVFHLAAAGVHPEERDPNILMEMNACFPGRMVKISEQLGAKAIVVLGSSAEYKTCEKDKPLKEHVALETSKLYGATKASGSLLALAMGVNANISVGVVRLFNVFGKGEAPHRLLPSLYQKLSKGHPVKLSAGTQIRDFIYIDDVCIGLCMIIKNLLEKKITSGIYNLGTGIGHSVADFSRQVARLMDADEDLLKFGALPYRSDDAPYVVADMSFVQEVLGWMPKFSMEEGIRHALSEPFFTTGVS